MEKEKRIKNYFELSKKEMESYIKKFNKTYNGAMINAGAILSSWGATIMICIIMIKFNIVYSIFDYSKKLDVNRVLSMGFDVIVFFAVLLIALALNKRYKDEVKEYIKYELENK